LVVGGSVVFLSNVDIFYGSGNSINISFKISFFCVGMCVWGSEERALHIFLSDTRLYREQEENGGGWMKYGSI